MGRRLAVQDPSRPSLACEGCGATVDQSWGKVRYCSSQCSNNAGHRRRYQDLPTDVRRLKGSYVPVPQHVVACEACSAPIVRRGDEQRRFCPQCRRGKGHRARATRYGVPFETFSREAVFVRDDWTCQLCRRPVDKGLSWPHAESVSLDHILPLSRGGAHVESNVQTAHLGCNTGKGARS